MFNWFGGFHNFVGDHPMDIPTKCGSNWGSCFGEDQNVKTYGQWSDTKWKAKKHNSENKKWNTQTNKKWIKYKKIK